jgi:excisionase family DNA binding protein
VDDYSLLSVREAADRLGVGPVAVRKRIASGRLPAVKRGRDWWLDARVVQRAERERAGAGRPLAPEMAWAVLLLASGDEAVADQVAGRDRYRSRARQWLREHPLAEHAHAVRARARREAFEAHPSELRRLRERPDILLTGASVADLVGLVGEAQGVELYAPASERGAVVAEHALMAGPGNVIVRWVPDAVWAGLDAAGQVAPRAAVLVDLLEGDEPRARHEAARALAS